MDVTLKNRRPYLTVTNFTNSMHLINKETVKSMKNRGGSLLPGGF